MRVVVEGKLQEDGGKIGFGGFRPKIALPNKQVSLRD
jgi:hypothetical protein